MGRARATRGQRRGLEPAGPLWLRRGLVAVAGMWVLRRRGTRASRVPGGLPAPLGAGKGRVRARVRGGADAGCGPVMGRTRWGAWEWGGGGTDWRPAECGAGENGPAASADPRGQDAGLLTRAGIWSVGFRGSRRRPLVGLQGRSGGQGQRGRQRPEGPASARATGDGGGCRSQGAASPPPPPSAALKEPTV